MWKEVFDGETVVERVKASYFPDDGDLNTSRRVSAASDDSFDASSYVHVENKLNSKMPKCLLNDENTNQSVDNHFSKINNTKTGNDVTKNGKRVIRKRLSVSEFNATRFSPKNVNNNNANSHDIVTSSSSSDSDTLPKPEKKSKSILSAKIQHLVFEMKRLRQLDRDILRKFLVINDTIEEQRWLVEEKQEAIKRSMSEEGDDPVALNFDTVREVSDEQEDDEESIHSVLSRQNSNRSESFSNDDIISPTEKENNQSIPTSKKTMESDLASTSSDSALSMSGDSSTLSSTTSIPVSNRSLSPPTSHSFIKSSSTDTSSHNNDKKMTSASQHASQTNEEDYADDIEGYYRMHGASMKRGSYPFPRQTQSFDAGHLYASRSHHYDDGALDSAYSTRRSSKDSDSRDAAEYARAVRMNAVNRSYAAPYYHADKDAQLKPRPRSASTSNDLKIENRNRAQRISVRPDGTHETQIGISTRHSFSEKPSAAYRLMHHPLHQRHLARMNVTRQLPHLSFVPIAEQEPDVMYENGRLYSNDSDCGSKFENQKVVENTQRQIPRNLRQCPPVMRKPSASGSAGSLTSSSSRTSTSSLASSGSNSSLPSPTKFATNEVAEYFVRQKIEPVWVRRRHSVQINDYVIPYNSKGFPASYAPKYSAPAKHVSSKPQVEKARFIPAKRANSYRPKAENERVLTVSYKPTNKGANEAVYNWIQTQDDVTYL